MLHILNLVIFADAGGEDQPPASSVALCHVSNSALTVARSDVHLVPNHIIIGSFEKWLAFSYLLSTLFISPPCKLLDINTVHVQNLNFVVVVPADVQTPSCVKGVEISLGRVPTAKQDRFCSQFLCLIMIWNMFLPIKHHYSKWSGQDIVKYHETLYLGMINK